MGITIVAGVGDSCIKRALGCPTKAAPREASGRELSWTYLSGTVVVLEGLEHCLCSVAISTVNCVGMVVSGIVTVAH